MRSTMTMKSLVAAVALSAAGLVAAPVSAQNAVSMSDLLKKVEQGRVQDNKESRAREAAFAKAKTEQTRLLNEAEAQRKREEARSQTLETQAAANKEELRKLEQELTVRLGSLKELFGVMQQVAGDSRTRFEGSVTNLQYPERVEFLENLAKKIGSSTQLPSLEEIDQLWFELMREMTESGKVVRLNSTVKMADGTNQDLPIVRVGVFNVVTDGKYLQYSVDSETGEPQIKELPRQPEGGRFTGSTSDLIGANEGLVRFGIDPTLGGVLATLVDRPNLRERVDQGGLVGYLILGLGLIGLLMSLERMVVLGIASSKVSAQLKSNTVSDNNALGRVLSVYDNNKSAETDTLELKLSEAIFKETPALNRGVLFIKIISVIAPLMGLLGTVTGMIKTFQSITLYGTGDPKLMAGGISQALVTTVLGLVVAIPMVLLHTLVSGRSKRIVQVLQEQSAGIIAEHAEQHTKRV